MHATAADDIVCSEETEAAGAVSWLEQETGPVDGLI